jgi:hypothetical protein
MTTDVIARYREEKAKNTVTVEVKDLKCAALKRLATFAEEHGLVVTATVETTKEHVYEELEVRRVQVEEKTLGDQMNNFEHMVITAYKFFDIYDLGRREQFRLRGRIVRLFDYDYPKMKRERDIGRWMTVMFFAGDDVWYRR